MRTFAIAILLAMVGLTAARAEGDARRGAQAYRACAACHSLEQGRNLTGPSLAGIFGRKAGSLPNFRRYSPALKDSDVVWTEQTLDAWIADPAHFVPDNAMPFPGIKDAGTRADLLAYLKNPAAAGSPTADMQGGMMMGGGRVPNLRGVDDASRVEAITHCDDTYRVTTADRRTRDFWERNLRFKTDSSSDGPNPGAPAILDAGMAGDRASVIFAAPDEISAFVKTRCP